MQLRFNYLFSATIFLIISLGILEYSSELGVWRGWTGDVMIIGFLYFLVQGMVPMSRWVCIMSIVLLGFCIEYLQYLDFAQTMGWQDNRVMMIVFGSVFDPLDLVAYMVGGLLAWGVDTIFIGKSLAKK